jgi:cytochrome c-type protein NapB
MTGLRTSIAGALVASALVLACGAINAQTAPKIVPQLTGEASPMTNDPAAPFARPITDDKRVMRNYPEQPPVIPHSIDGYQIDLNGNKCLSCHARSRTGESQAPMISITHFMDRDGQFLATVSPRRFFCTQCHVPQHETKPPVENTFVDIDALLAREAPGGSRR